MKQKIKKIKNLPSCKLLICRECGNNKFEVWLETIGGLTGIYCKCGRRLCSGVSTDYQRELLK